MRAIPNYRLWIGNAGDLDDLRYVLSAGIEAVVDLAIAAQPRQLTRELIYVRVPLTDSEGNSDGFIQSAVNILTSLLTIEIPTLVCCDGGMSRSPCIAAAAIAGLRQTTMEEALQIVIQSGPVDISPGFLLNVKQSLRHRKLGPI
jgi:protein-tyrosine phosphatase